MKTLIKRPNYTLLIKTSCYSAFSFYTFFRNDRIPALPTATLLPYCLVSLINLQSFLTEAFLFCLIDRRTNSLTVLLHCLLTLIALLTALTSALYIGESRPHLCFIYRPRPN